MSYGNSSLVSGSRTNRRPLEFGRTHVVKPKGRHQATIVWLHGLGDNGSSCSQLLESLPLPNIKWICPTAPTRPVAGFGGFPCTAWFDVGEISVDGPDDVEGMESQLHILQIFCQVSLLISSSVLVASVWVLQQPCTLPVVVSSESLETATAIQ
ncbi:acyl-protein thioesterase 2-like [Iris pallida]|uniref:Acyl-protein thioesterase 2-like n=1 Tax=Iris pallida TaxID=29817 RepID=A0AAX6EUE7_IRIPA|nr:acyl-protein thioesterase 2-like [Iris pallida]